MAFDAFLKIEGIPGESLDKTHKDEIEIDSYSWGVANAGSFGSGSGGGVGKASPLLMKACATGQHIKEATITVRKAGSGGFEFLKIKLSDILVSSLSPGGAGGDSDLPEDQVSLNFVKIDFLYTVQRTGEVVETDFDQGRNT
jgi:type VI secretion system secreted protein Hcp